MKASPELSIVLSRPNDTIRTRKVAILAADGCDDGDLDVMLRALTAEGALAKAVGPRLGYLRTSTGRAVKIHFSLLTASSVLFDALYIPGGADSISILKRDPAALEFVFETYKHAKAIATAGSGLELLRAAAVPEDETVAVAENGASEDWHRDLSQPLRNTATGNAKKCCAWIATRVCTDTKVSLRPAAKFRKDNQQFTPTQMWLTRGKRLHHLLQSD